MSAVCYMAMFAEMIFGADTPKELEPLQGTWIIVSCHAHGKRLDAVTGARVTIAGNQMNVSDGKKVITSSTIRVSRAVKPAEFDALPGDVPGNKTWVPGIFEIDGDTLRIGTAITSFVDVPESKTKVLKIVSERPSSFDDKTAMISVLKREKK